MVERTDWMTDSGTTKNASCIWSDIEGWEGLYQVSNFGEVRRLYKDPRSRPFRILKQAKSNGYCQVSLSRNGIYSSHYVHRLVAIAFVDGDQSLSVDHIDANKTNNNADNLQWLTNADNARRSWPRANGRCY